MRKNFRKKYTATGIFISLMFIFLNFNLTCTDNGANKLAENSSSQNVKIDIDTDALEVVESNPNTYTQRYYPIYITIDLHLDPLPEHASPVTYVPGDGASMSVDDGIALYRLIEDKASIMEARLSAIEWA